MGLDAVAYELENWKGILASRCKLFTDIDTSYIPLAGLCGRRAESLPGVLPAAWTGSL